MVILGSLSYPDFANYTYLGKVSIDGTQCDGWRSESEDHEYYDTSNGTSPILWNEPGFSLIFEDFENRKQVIKKFCINSS